MSTKVDLLVPSLHLVIGEDHPTFSGHTTDSVDLEDGVLQVTSVEAINNAIDSFASNLKTSIHRCVHTSFSIRAVKLLKDGRRLALDIERSEYDVEGACDKWVVEVPFTADGNLA